MSGQFEKIIDDFFGEAAERLGDDYRGVLEKCGISTAASFSNLPVSQMNALCNELYITLDSIAAGRVDLLAIQDHLTGGSALPPKYVRSVPFSSRFTSIYMLNYLRSTQGRDPVKSMCQHFQVKDDHFTDHSEKNNLLLPHDICSYVRTYFGEDVVEAMGESSFDIFRMTEAASDLVKQKTIHQFFEKFIFDIMPVYVERNFVWNIDSTGPNSIQISGQPRGDVVAGLNFKHQGVEALEGLRLGFIRALPKLIGIQDAKVEKIRCISSGDAFDTYLIHYGRPAKISSLFH